MSKQKVLVGVLAGIATGALLGILFAPDKGSETRKKIAKKSTDTMDEWKDKFEDLICSITDKFKTAKVELADIYEKGVGEAEELKKAITPTKTV